MRVRLMTAKGNSNREKRGKIKTANVIGRRMEGSVQSNGVLYGGSANILLYTDINLVLMPQRQKKAYSGNSKLSTKGPIAAFYDYNL